MKLKFPIVVCAFIFLTSCQGPKTLQMQVNRKTYEPLLIHDKNILEDKSSKTLKLTIVDRANLSDLSEVSKKNGYFLPLLLFSVWNYDMVITLGNHSSNPRVVSFVQSSIEETFERSGDFIITDSTSQSPHNYLCEITIDSINVNCDYNRTGMSSMNFYSASETAYSSKGFVKLTLDLIENDKSVLSKTYSIEKSVNFIKTDDNIKNVKHHAMKNLIENLTLSTKEIAENMVNDVNSKVE